MSMLIYDYAIKFRIWKTLLSSINSSIIQEYFLDLYVSREVEFK